MFDFEAGGESTNQSEVDVWWDQKTNTERALVPLNGAQLCGMGIVDYNALGYDDLKNLPFAATPLIANVTGTNTLPTHSTFVVRTRRGTLVKVLVVNYDYNLQLQWQPCARPVNALDVKIVLGNAPAWLVSRYVVQCTYPAPGGPKPCGDGIFGADGGILQGKVTDETGAFPPSVSLSVIMDFVPATGVAPVSKSVSVPVTATGASYIFEPYGVLQKVDLFLDLHPAVMDGDFCLVKWKHTATDGRTVASGQTMMNIDALRTPTLPTCEIVFVPDPVAPKDYSISIDGQFQGQPLAPFAHTAQLSDKAFLIRAHKSTGGPGYELSAE